jgi:hypothetical protein
MNWRSIFTGVLLRGVFSAQSAARGKILNVVFE